MHDIVIAGAGPAGMTAALYALRGGRSVLLLEKESVGGQMASSAMVENYPAVESVPGVELADRMLSRVLDMGADLELDEAAGLEISGLEMVVAGAEGRYPCRSVIIASGVRHRKLGIPGEEELLGRGVSYCAVCDGAFFKGKRAAVVGGGATAVQSALELSGLCSRVYILYRRSRFTRVDSLSLAALERRDNITIIFDTVVTAALERDGALGALELETGGRKDILETDAMFVAAGLDPANECFSPPLRLDPEGYLEAGEDCRTCVDGVFAAGDCRTKSVRQITTAVADGAVAALAACDYLSRLQ
ncbi:MAG: FAD-dependent oxidoreductase [Oscillospiraceae bacterium]|nr:FAD-dependent oxidoreductase [Oscillospiraceae bacterium]